MNWTLEVVVLRVTDVDLAKSFYIDKAWMAALSCTSAIRNGNGWAVQEIRARA